MNDQYYVRMVKWLQGEYGDKVGLFLANRMAKMIIKTNDLCIDNFRACRIGDLKEEDAYRIALDDGCCAFADKVFIFKQDGLPDQQYKIGFNYGH